MRPGGAAGYLKSSIRKKKRKHWVASKVQLDERQRLKVAQQGRARRNVQEADDEVDHYWTAACEGIAKKNMLKYVEDSEVMKVSTRELKEQVLSPDESSEKMVRKARQARSELFQIFRHGANEVLIARKVR